MHMKGLITNDYWTIVGSYNFSLAAWYKNWEQLVCVRSRQVDTLWFDALWGSLRDREIDLWNYDASSLDFGTSRRDRNMLLHLTRIPRSLCYGGRYNRPIDQDPSVLGFHVSQERRKNARSNWSRFMVAPWGLIPLSWFYCLLQYFYVLARLNVFAF